jgi:hypothetical protein
MSVQQPSMGSKQFTELQKECGKYEQFKVITHSSYVIKSYFSLVIAFGMLMNSRIDVQSIG